MAQGKWHLELPRTKFVTARMLELGKPYNIRQRQVWMYESEWVSFMPKAGYLNLATPDWCLINERVLIADFPCIVLVSFAKSVQMTKETKQTAKNKLQIIAWCERPRCPSPMWQSAPPNRVWAPHNSAHFYFSLSQITRLNSAQATSWRLSCKSYWAQDHMLFSEILPADELLFKMWSTFSKENTSGVSEMGFTIAS